jgi:hypothetical protein
MILDTMKLNQDILSIIYKRVTSMVEWRTSWTYYESTESFVSTPIPNLICTLTTATVIDNPICDVLLAHTSQQHNTVEVLQYSPPSGSLLR